MNKEAILNYFYKNKGKIIGLLLGLIFSILTLTIGFFRTVFIVICTVLGYYIGKKIDNNEDVIELLQRIMPNEWK